MTGRGLGDCGLSVSPEERNGSQPGRRIGVGAGRGMQRGFRRGFCRFDLPGRAMAPAAPPQVAGVDGVDLTRENARLKAEATELRQRLDALEKRVAGLNREPGQI